jgi:hypothetical protein
MLFVGELSGGAWTVLLVNTQQNPATLTFNMTHIGGGGKFSARDLWKHEDLPGTFSHADVLTFTDIGAHDCVLLKLSMANEAPSSLAVA